MQSRVTLHLVTVPNVLVAGRLRKLADTTFNEEAWRPRFKDFGWDLAPAKYGEAGDFYFVFGAPNSRLNDGDAEGDFGVISFNSRDFGMPLARLDSELRSAESRRDYFEAFILLQRMACGEIGEPQLRLQYAVELAPETMYLAAVWRGKESDLFLVQHCEGDLQCGCHATIDFRIRPRTDGNPSLPLVTNIIF
jgi:hypothetical protein